jgi:hypothetical protein
MQTRLFAGAEAHQILLAHKVPRYWRRSYSLILTLPPVATTVETRSEASRTEVADYLRTGYGTTGDETLRYRTITSL